MFAPYKIKVGARAVALAANSFSAHAVLERAGPISTVNKGGGFTAWYQDTTGIALEFCSNDAAELAGGWCRLLPPIVNNAGNLIAAPEVFPNNFFIEHFFFGGSAAMDQQGGERSILFLSQEASFANGVTVVPGEQMAFARIRVVLSPVPVTGTYRFIHPYGEEIIDGTAGDRTFFTDDVGITYPGNFDCSLSSRLGPFLLPSDTPGGVETPPLTATNSIPDQNPAHFGGVFAPTPYPGTGKSYIADPARLGPVTGSQAVGFDSAGNPVVGKFLDSTGQLRDHNVFRIEGPPGSAMGVDPATGAVVDWAETTDFSLKGSLFEGFIAIRAVADRASYTRNATQLKVDVVATGNPATASRLPTQPPAAKDAPTLTFFNAPCADTAPNILAPLGAIETQMLSTGSQYWAQIQPTALPTAICLKNANARDASGQIVPTYATVSITDEVTIAKADYDPTAKTLTVNAASSNTRTPPVLSVAYPSFGANLTSGVITVSNVSVPPPKVTVTASKQGRNELIVNTPLADNDLQVTASPIASLAGWHKNEMEIPVEYSVSATRIDGKRHTICILRDIMCSPADEEHAEVHRNEHSELSAHSGRGMKNCCKRLVSLDVGALTSTALDEQA